MDERELERILANLRIGIARIESGGSTNPYQARPGFKKYAKGHAKEGQFILDENGEKQRISSATGKYQFLKSWLKDSISNGKRFKGIKSFAAESGLFDPVETMDDFANQPELQEAFFTHYAKEVLIPAAEKAIVKNPLNLSIDEAASQFHFQAPQVALKGIQSGSLTKKTDTNVSGYKYIDRYREGLNEVGLKPVTANDIIQAKKEKLLPLTANEKSIEKRNEEVVKQFEEKNKAIDKLGLEQGPTEALRKKLFQQVTNSGHKEIINASIESKNKKEELSYTEKIADYKILQELVENSTVGYNNKKNEFNKDEAYLEVLTKEDRAKYEKLKDKYDFFTDPKGKNYPAGVTMNTEKMLKAFEGLHKDITGEEIKVTAGYDKNTNEKGSYGVMNPEIFASGLKIFTENKKGKIQLEGLGGTIVPFKKTATIGKDIVSDQSMSEKYDPKEDETKTEEDVKEEVKEAEKVKASTSPNAGLTDEYFKNELALNSLQDDQMNYQPGKKELNIDAIVGLSLGLIGNEQAKNAKIPLRTEEVSQAMKNYTAELAAKSKEGLPVEVEAQMKGLLADAYQGGLAQIVNASAGNRATVLGNLGALEQAKTKGLVGIQVADYEAKDRAFAQYGKAIEYINDFDTRRDIANHAIKYQEGKEKQKEGKELAAAGFGKLIDALKYDKENGPGSANDMYRSLLMQKMFGFDPKAKDDQTGNVVGTKSWYDKNKQATQDKFKDKMGVYDAFQKLNPNARKVVDEAMALTQDPTVINGLISHLQSGADPLKMSMENLQEAIKTKNYGLLTVPDAAPKGTPDPTNPALPSYISETPEPTTPIQMGGEHSIPDPIGTEVQSKVWNLNGYYDENGNFPNLEEENPELSNLATEAYKADNINKYNTIRNQMLEKSGVLKNGELNSNYWKHGPYNNSVELLSPRDLNEAKNPNATEMPNLEGLLNIDEYFKPQ